MATSTTVNKNPVYRKEQSIRDTGAPHYVGLLPQPVRITGTKVKLSRCWPDCQKLTALIAVKTSQTTKGDSNMALEQWLDATHTGHRIENPTSKISSVVSTRRNQSGKGNHKRETFIKLSTVSLLFKLPWYHRTCFGPHGYLGCATRSMAGECCRVGQRSIIVSLL